MKFYNGKGFIYYWKLISAHKLTAIYCSRNIVFFKNGLYHNNKNAAYRNANGYKWFYLNSEYYGNQYNFNKKSWRRFVKLKVFL